MNVEVKPLDLAEGAQRLTALRAAAEGLVKEELSLRESRRHVEAELRQLENELIALIRPLKVKAQPISDTPKPRQTDKTDGPAWPLPANATTAAAILKELDENGSLSIKDLCDFIKLAHQPVYQAVRKCVARGMVEQLADGKSYGLTEAQQALMRAESISATD